MITIITKNGQKPHEGQSKILGGKFENVVKGKIEQFGLGKVVQFPSPLSWGELKRGGNTDKISK